MLLIPNGKQPCASELKRYIESAGRRFPVLHLMPMDRPLGVDACPYLINRLASGRYAIKPNITRQSFLYMGMPLDESWQNLEAIQRQKPFVYSSLFNELKEDRDSRNSRLYRNIQREDFVFMLNSYPLYALLRDGIEFGNGRIFRMDNPYGLANLYDYSTSLVRMTSDIDVALLHATNDYDSENSTFSPTRSQYGVLFVFELRRPFGMTPGLSNLGRWPLLRTFYGKYFLFDLLDGMPFDNLANVKGFVFRQDEDESLSFMQLFDNGMKLYPSVDVDPIAKKAKSKREDVVSRSAFEENLRSNPRDNREENMEGLQLFNCSIDDSYDFRFTHDELKEMRNQMMEAWDVFCSELYSPYNREKELCDILRNLPQNNKYKMYFNVDDFAQHAQLK